MLDRSRRVPSLRVLWDSLPRGIAPMLALYVALSLCGAFAGSIAAVLLVPLVQPSDGMALPRFLTVLPGGEAAIGAFAVVSGLFAVLRWQAARVGARLVADYGLSLRRRVQARLVDASLVRLARSTSAEIANVLTHNVEIAVQGFTALQQLLVAGTTAAVSLAFAFWVSPPLMLAAPAIALVGFLVSRILGREQAEVSRRYVADMTHLFWQSEDVPRRLRHLRSYGREAAEKSRYAEAAARLGQGYARQLELVASGRLLLEWTATLGIAGLFVLARHWRGVDASSLMAVCLLLGRLLPYLVSTRQSFQQWHSAIPALDLWQSYMALDADAPTRPDVDARTEAETVWIEHVRVCPPAGGIELENLPLTPGELIFVSGDSGAGKSSLVDVLAGMMPPAAFAARAEGVALDFDAYRARVRRGAYVSQGVRPWQRTVRDGLAWAAPEADEAMLCDALAAVGLLGRLDDDPAGLDLPLAGSANRLSGGELQRLLLAQVLLRQPRLAVLDEATSALDAAAERAVLGALKQRLPGSTLLVVSHRPGVAALADRQVVLHGGRAVVTLVASTTPTDRSIARQVPRA